MRRLDAAGPLDRVLDRLRHAGAGASVGGASRRAAGDARGARGVSAPLKRLGVVGARGYAGGELLRLAARHGGFEVAYLASRALAGQPFSALAPDLGEGGTIAAPDPQAAARAKLDACVLAMPNGEAKPYVDAIDATSPDTVIVDFSADFRG